MKKILISFLAFALLAFLPGATRAGTPSKNTKKKEYVPVHTIISAISDTSITTKTNSSDGKGDKTNTYTITKDTVIELRGNRAKVKDLQVGLRVSVEVGNRPDVAARISASDPPKDPPKPAPKK